MIDETREKELQEKFHQKKVRVATHYKVQDVAYLVTACLRQGDEFIFAILGENYNPPSNPNWITIHMNDEEVFKLEERFQLIKEDDNMTPLNATT